MAGKVRYMIALLVVISLIYMQHSTVTYAGEKEQNRMLSQEKEEDIKKKIKDAMKEKELLEGEQDSNLTEGEEKPPVEVEEKPPVEVEEKPPCVWILKHPCVGITTAACLCIKKTARGRGGKTTGGGRG